MENLKKFKIHLQANFSYRDILHVKGGGAVSKKVGCFKDFIFQNKMARTIKCLNITILQY